MSHHIACLMKWVPDIIILVCTNSGSFVTLEMESQVEHCMTRSAVCYYLTSPDVILIIQNPVHTSFFQKHCVIVLRISLCSAAAQIKVKRSWRSSDRQSVFNWPCDWSSFSDESVTAVIPQRTLPSNTTQHPRWPSGPVKHPTVRCSPLVQNCQHEHTCVCFRNYHCWFDRW